MKYLFHFLLLIVIQFSCSQVNVNTEQAKTLNKPPYSYKLECEVLNDYINYNTYFVEPRLEIADKYFDSIRNLHSRHQNPNDNFKFSMLLTDSLEAVRENTFLNYFDRVWDSTFINIDSVLYDSLKSKKLNLQSIYPKRNFKLIRTQVGNYNELDSLYNESHFKGWQFYSRMIFNKMQNKVIFYKHFGGKYDAGTYLVKLKKVNTKWEVEFEEIIAIS